MSEGNTNNTVFIQKLFTSRDNFVEGNVEEATANIATYVGQEGRIWWNPVTNTLYYSDGNTPGGFPIYGFGSGNGTVYGSNTWVQYNNNGNFGGSATFTFDSTTEMLSAPYLAGDGSNITNLPLDTYTGNITGGNINISGNANLGNFVIYDQTLAGTIVDRDITINPVANGYVSILGPVSVHGDGNVSNTASFVSLPDGQTRVYVPVADPLAGAFSIVGTSSGSIVPLGNPGGMLHITGQNGEVSRIYNDAVANYALYVGRRYNGLASAPTGILINQVVSRIGANPYLTDSPNFTPFGFAKIDFTATENQTTTAQGSKIELYATPNGANVQTLVASFNAGGIAMGGNIIPTIDNIYSLGNISNRWIGAYFGNAGIYIQDATTGDTGQLSLDDGTFLVDSNITAIQVGNTRLTQEGLSSTDPAANIQIGIPGDTGYTYIRNAGIEFPDSSIQTTAAIPLSYLGNAFGVATLGADSKVTPSQLPAGSVFFKGTWDASTNTPTLADGSGTAGWEYQCVVPGTVDFGSGPIAFASGDFVIYNGALWQRIPGSGAGVSSFNTRTGVVTLTSGDVTTALTTGSIVNSKLQNSNIVINSGGGLQGGATVSLGGSVTLTANVRDITAGTGVTVTPTSGNYTIAIGQPVATTDTVQFVALSTTTTIQASGNITGANLNTGGKVVATGNIETQANVTAANNITANGNVYGNYVIANVALYSSGDPVTGNGAVVVGASGHTITSNTIAQFVGNTPTYAQINFENLNANGSSDYVATADNGTDSTYFIDMGMNGSNFSDPAFTLFGKNDGYLYTVGSSGTGPGTAGNLIIGSTSGVVKVFTGNTQTANLRTTTSSAGFDVIGRVNATANINGANLTTGGQVVATGNITTSGYLKTVSTWINAGINTIGNVDFVSSANVSLGPIANIHITGGNVGDVLTTNGAGNLLWAPPLAANVIIQTNANTTVNVDFTYESTHLVYLPTGPVTVNLSNFVAGHTARVLVRYATPYILNTGIANAQQSTDGTIIIPISGAGGHKITGQQSVQLVYTCFDGTAANCYVAPTFL